MPDERYQHPLVAGGHSPMRSHCIEIFLWIVTCFGVWFGLARDLATAALCAALTIIPSAVLFLVLRRERRDGTDYPPL
jgi:hypothetical protein